MKLIMAAVGVFVVTIIIAYAALKLFDEPVRKWLTKNFQPSKPGKTAD